MSHETKIVHGKPLGDSKRWIAQCSCGRRSDSWLDCDDARANLADMHPPSVLPSDPRDAEIAALRAEVERLTRELSEPVARLQRALSDNDGFKVACEAIIAEKRLREKAEARVAALEAVERAARSEIAYMDETKAAHPDALVEPTLSELRAALARLDRP